MKKIIKTILCVFAIVLTVAFPALISKSVKDGIALCLYTLVPALLPFMLIVNIMQKHDLCSQISYILKPIFFKFSMFLFIIFFSSQEAGAIIPKVEFLLRCFPFINRKSTPIKF